MTRTTRGGEPGWVGRPDIGAHRLIGDGHTAALLRPDAHIDWWCHPTFAGTPLLWSLLDANGAGAWWCDTRPSRHDNDPAGASTRTVLQTGHGRVECWDGLLARGETSVLVRLVRPVDDAVTKIVHHLGLGGFETPAAEWSGDVAIAAGSQWRVTGGASTPCADGSFVRTRLPLIQGEWTMLTIGPATISLGHAGEVADELAAFTEERRQDCQPRRLPKQHGERAAHALAVVTALTNQATGAVVASPTTSLPEAPGFDRQFDYRYSWLRDGSLAMSVVALLGRKDLAQRNLIFFRDLGPDGILSSPVTDVFGQPVPDEREVPGVAGWAGSQPIRVGNAASDQLQYDAIGAVLDAVWIYVQAGGRLTSADWEITRALADRAAESDDPTSAGIWEFREPRRLVSADIGRWVALNRAVWIARTHRPTAPRRAWRQARDRARNRVVGALLPHGGLPQEYDGPNAADASSLVAVIAGLLGPRDPKAARLVDATLASLEAWPFLCRYEPGSDDGFDGIEGAFVPVSWWAVSALAVIGRVDEAEERADALCAAMPALLAEEVDLHSHTSLGNVPLVWSHMEAARALYLIEAARRRRHLGRVGFTAWRAGRLLIDRLKP